MNLIQLGEFTLNSGNKSWFKLEADKFIEDNLPGLVEMICRAVGPFYSVEGIPRGGNRLAEALQNRCDTIFSFAPLPHLLVDDVYTTGGSMERAKQKHSDNPQPIIGAVVFSRGPCPPWIKCIFQLPEELRLPK